ncbi:membrane protein [Pseudoalteromonas luteoviolacea]|uniref:Membrane protein n=1 Tax=Pseudoalteromonas luteoviolacea TaxID=43657 RepID=A0A0C1MS21_9GAMM|nr:DMT family transporter [Pseudoalteromonas luteoviolacea]KID57488.1 membrane protein [Pseudoalteromonas luteoviolacea]
MLQNTHSLVLYGLIMFIAGLGIPVMAALNGGLGNKLQNTPLAATILLFVGLCIALIYLFTSSGVPKTLFVAGTPWYFYLGGCFVMFYILTITWVAPKFGIANAITFVLLGQLVAMTIIDHCGFFGVKQFGLDLKRLTGLVLMIAGVLLVLSKPQHS